MVLTASALLLGLARGMGHALEPDHLAAVSTIVADSRGSRRVGLVLGAAWGLGHAAALLLVAGALCLLRARMPAHIESAFELGVALMLVGLGARALRRAVREGQATALAPRPHAHGERVHVHGTGAAHVHVRGWTLARRPLMVGLVHGLAGSGALTAAVLAKLPAPAPGVLATATSLLSAVAYIVLFSAGAGASMAAVSGLAGLPLARAAASPRALPLMLGGSGALSLGLGVAWAVPHVQRLFSL